MKEILTEQQKWQRWQAYMEAKEVYSKARQATKEAKALEAECQERMVAARDAWQGILKG